MPPREPEPGLHLGDLGAADRNPVRRRAVEFDRPRHRPPCGRRMTWRIATIWLRCTRTNRPGSSWASASEIDHGHIRSRVPSCTLCNARRPGRCAISAVSMKWVPSAPSTGSRGAGAARGGWPMPPSGVGRSAAGGCGTGSWPTRARRQEHRGTAAPLAGRGQRLRARIRHQRQQEAGRNHEAEQRPRPATRICGDAARPSPDDGATSRRRRPDRTCRTSRCNACRTPRRRRRSRSAASCTPPCRARNARKPP